MMFLNMFLKKNTTGATVLTGAWACFPYDTALEVARLLRAKKVLVRGKVTQWDLCMRLTGFSCIRQTTSKYLRAVAKINGRLQPGRFLNSADGKLARHISLCQGFWLYRSLGSSLRECPSAASTRRLQQQLCELGDRAFKKDIDWMRVCRDSLLEWQPDISLPNIFAYFRELRACRVQLASKYIMSCSLMCCMCWSVCSSPVATQSPPSLPPLMKNQTCQTATVAPQTPPPAVLPQKAASAVLPQTAAAATAQAHQHRALMEMQTSRQMNQMGMYQMRIQKKT